MFTTFDNKNYARSNNTWKNVSFSVFVITSYYSQEDQVIRKDKTEQHIRIKYIFLEKIVVFPS